MSLRSLRFLTLAVPLFVATGCTIIHTDGGPGTACGGDDDCSTSCACTNGFCEPRHEGCSSNLDCGSGQFCLSGGCRNIPPGSHACSSSQQCGMDTCFNGY